MEVVYFLISIFFVFFTFFAAKALSKANFAILNFDVEVEKKNLLFKENLSKLRKKLKACMNFFKLYEKFAVYSKISGKISKIKTLVDIINFIQGKPSKRKFKLFPVLRKILFFI